MGLIQEKFQVQFEPPSTDNQWASAASARRASGAKNLNAMPPGQNIDDQPLANTRTPTRTMAAEGDVTKTWTREAVKNGFTRYNVKPTDDSYTGEHTDTFYGEAVSDGETGFAERGNLLDRI